LLLGIIGLAACSEYDIVGEGDPTIPDPTTPGVPIADAGEDMVTTPLVNARLDGRGSYDGEGLPIMEYTWTVVSVPEGSTASLSDDKDDRPVFFVDVVGDYVFDLTVRNSHDVWDATPDRVTVTAEPSQEFYVQLTWDTTADLDLHLLDGTGALYEIPGDANWCNPVPEWSGPGLADDPSLEWDETQGYGPETIVMELPAAGAYPIKVVYYGQQSPDGVPAPFCSDSPCPVTLATVRVFHNGVEQARMAHALTRANQVWHVGNVTWPGATIVPTDTLGTTQEIGCF